MPDFLLVQSLEGGPCSPERPSLTQASRRSLLRAELRTSHLRTCLVGSKSEPATPSRDPGGIRLRLHLRATWLVRCEHGHHQMSLHRETASPVSNESKIGYCAS